MESELQQWICETVIVEAKKLLRLKSSGVSDLKQTSLQGTTKDCDNAIQVHLSGTRAVQIIDVSVRSQGILQLVTDTFPV